MNITSVKMLTVVMEGVILMQRELTMTDNHEFYSLSSVFTMNNTFLVMLMLVSFIYYFNFSVNNTL